MPFKPTIKNSTTAKDLTDVFKGYNHNLKIAENEFYETKNLSTSFYPMLAPRGKRGTVLTMQSPGGLIEKDALGYVANGTLYYNFQATGVTNLSEGKKKLVSFGAYILIFPDKVYYNTEDPTDYGSIEGNYTYTGTVEYVMCHYDGTPYTSVYKGDEAPSASEGYELWIETSAGTTSTVVYSYSRSEKTWVELNTVYTKIIFPTYGQLPKSFSDMDGVEISGCFYDDINGSKILYGVGGDSTTKDYVVVVHQLNNQTETKEGESITISRTIPTMDYICEAKNRLWGCYYGFDNDTGKTLNEIYCCALGDFKNWNQFLGVSTDSWVGSVGSDGEWTGCINYLGTPTFFKENRLHTVSISTTGAHQLSETPCRGVQKGSWDSLRIVNETLYYKGRTGICAYRGSFPDEVSEVLGDVKYYEAVAGCFGEKYYVSMRDQSSTYHLFVYDISKGLWVHEDNTRVVSFAKVDDELYAVCNDGKLLAMNGTSGTLETDVEWIAESGVIVYSTNAGRSINEHKYISRFDIRCKGETGSYMDVFIQYDSEGQWYNNGRVTMNGVNSVVLPIRPRRCDHLKLRFSGKGNMKIFSIAKIREVGSDV